MKGNNGNGSAIKHNKILFSSLSLFQMVDGCLKSREIDFWYHALYSISIIYIIVESRQTAICFCFT